MANQPQRDEQPKAGVKAKAFLTGAIVAGSAIAGGLAVVLWNRKALARLLQHPEPVARPSIEEDSDET
jgi:hypothetical protein